MNKNTGGRRSKYNSEVASLISKVIRETGSDSIAIDASGIASSTFYKWQAEIKEFSELISEARAEFNANTAASCFDRINAANNYLDEILKGSKYKTIYRDVLDNKGTIHTLVTREQVILSDKLFERVLGAIKPQESDQSSFQVHIQVEEETFEEVAPNSNSSDE